MGAGAPGRGDDVGGVGVGVAAGEQTPDAPLAAGSTESGRDVLDRWELHGAVWRVALLRDDHAEVDLRACTGELMDRLVSSEPDLIAYLRTRPSSEDPAG